jgi:hypothetical protein
MKTFELMFSLSFKIESLLIFIAIFLAIINKSFSFNPEESLTYLEKKCEENL